jgi:co-chaperonin GroES (HSP10)
MRTAVKGELRPLRDNVFISDMEFGEQKSRGGIVLLSDDAKDHGIHPRWGKVFAKGKENKDQYEVGHWVLVKHGRWTRGMKYETESGDEIIIRMIDTDDVLCWAEKQPDSTTVLGTIDSVSPPSLSDFGKVL